MKLRIAKKVVKSRLAPENVGQPRYVRDEKTAWRNYRLLQRAVNRLSTGTFEEITGICVAECPQSPR
jgi:hypothetical protein